MITPRPTIAPKALKRSTLQLEPGRGEEKRNPFTSHHSARRTCEAPRSNVADEYKSSRIGNSPVGFTWSDLLY